MAILVFLLFFLATAPVFAWMNFDLSKPIDTLADNSVVDIIYDGTYVWLATGSGVSGTSDGGVSWRTFNNTNGLTRNSVSALAAQGRRLWIATSYDTSSSGSTEKVPSGGGVQITDDTGSNWHSVEPYRMSSPGKLAYDLAVYDSSVWAPCYYGGLLRSLDYGENWENVYVDSIFRDDIENRRYNLYAGRYFSTVVDTYHKDSVIVWAGSAGGVQRFYYISKRKKLASNRINDIAFDGRYWWYGTDRGLSKFSDSLSTYETYDSSNGFPGNFISAAAGSGDLICAGVYDTLTQHSLGLVISTDGGTSWALSAPLQAVGADRMVEGIVVDSGDVWAACGPGGLIRSSDNGSTWHTYHVDSLNADTPDVRNVYHCIDIGYREGYERVVTGTDSGIVIYYFQNRGALDSTAYLSFPDSATYSRRIISVAGMVTAYGDEIWAAARPPDSDSTLTPAVLRTTDRGQTWTTNLMGPPPATPTDIKIQSQFRDRDTVVWVGTTTGIRSSINFGQKWDAPAIIDDNNITRYIDRTTPILSVEISAKETKCGSLGEGFGAYREAPIDSTHSKLVWFVYKAQINPYIFDFVYRSAARLPSTACDTCIGGNFIPAMALQRIGDSTIIWAATRATDSSEVTAVSFTTDRGRTWRNIAVGALVWNFDFNGDTVFIASSQGLYMTTDYGANWDKLSIKEPVSGRVIESNVEVYAAKFINGELWVGTNDGVARSANLRDWSIFRVFFGIPESAADDSRSYVSPNPYSPYLTAGKMKFHYRLKSGGTISIKVYDFANNLVKKVVDGAVRAAGVQYDDIDLWDGHNENGDKVAAGVYIYVVESSGGDKFWGKFMVIP